MYTHCPFCRRDTVEQNLCIICYFNFDDVNKKSGLSYENKLMYFKKTLKIFQKKYILIYQIIQMEHIMKF